METIEFIIPTYWEIWEFLSQVDLKFVASAAVAFCIGFVIRRFLSRRLMNEKGAEIKELRKRLQVAENLSDRVKSSKPVEETDTESVNEHVSLESISHREIEDPDIMDDLYSLEGLEPAELWELYHKPEHRKVVVTKVIGVANAGTPLQTPELGFEILPPVVGKSYQVELDDGRLLKTSVVTNISDGYIQTRNSLYKVEVLNRGGDFSQRNQNDE